MKRILILLFITLAALPSLHTTPVPDAATAQLLLDLHNVERQAVGLPNLSWSANLSNSSQVWADYLASTNQFYHSGTAWVGENIAEATYRSNMTASMFGQWSAEKNYFNPTQPYGANSTTDPTQEVGHYTQIVWSMTFEVGCGISNGTTMGVLVCQYRYAGNYAGNWVYKPDPTNPWKAAQPVVDAASLPPPPTPNTYPTTLDSATATQLLNLHNIERTFVGMKNVTWSSTLAAQAQAWANKQAKAGTFSLSGTAGVGENMQLATIRPDIVHYMFNLWANEKMYFDATQKYPKCAIGGKMVSHYTQIVWSATTQIGCGVATNSVNSLIVCQYSLAGNYIGNYAVFPAPTTNFEFTQNW